MEFLRTTGDGTGFSGVVKSSPFGIRPQNITISTPGKDYKNGETFSITATTGATSASGYIIVNDSGAITRMVLTAPYVGGGTFDAITINTEYGTGFTGTATISANVLEIDTAFGIGGIPGLRIDNERGLNYKRGDLVFATTDGAGPAVAEGNQAGFRINQI